MFKHSSSTLGLCIALFLVFSITFSSFPKTRSVIVLAQTGRTLKSAPTSDQQRGSAAPTARAQPQRTPAPNAAQVVTITATNRDSFPVHLDGTAHQGDVITYSVAITNSGDTDATGVNFNDTVDANTSTLVGGSPTIQFTVTGDTYSAIGNVRLDTSTITPGSGQTVLENDTTNGATLTGFGATLAAANGTVPNGTNTVTTSNNGTVTMNANGSFTYNPPAGLGGAGATDSFWYTLTNNTLGTGNPSGFPSASARVTINVSTPIWFVNQAAAGGGDGRLSTPFNCLTGAGCFSAVNDGVGSHPAAGDIIFLYKSPTPPAAFIGGVTLLNNQKLIGEGASQSLATIAGVSVPPGSDPLPSTGNAPPVVTTGGASINGINIGLGNSNTLRGFTIGNTTGFKIASGANFGTLTVSEVALSGTGGDLSLSSGNLAATFTSITSTGGAAAQGIALSSVLGSMTVTSGTSITNPGTQCILVSGSTVTADFGNTSCTGGTDGVSLQNNSSGTRTFGTLGVLGGSGDAFIHGAGGGNVTVNGVATLTSALDPVNIQNVANGTLINFAGGATVTKITTGGAGVTWAGTNTGATLTFNSLSVTTSNGAGMVMSGGGTVNVTNGTGSISATGSGAQPAPAIAVSSAIALNANFSSVSSTNSGGGSNGISLVNVTGTSNFGTGSLAGAAGATFLVSGSTGTVTYDGTITQGNAARVVDIQNKTGGTIALGGAVSSTGGTGTGIFLNSNTGATINFTGGISLSTGANDSFTATGGGTVSATQNNTTIVNTLSTTAGTALKVTSTTIGLSGLTFRSISSGSGANSASNGIILDTTGTSGGLTVVGNGSAGTGGTIQHKTGADGSTTQGSGIFLNNTSGVSLDRMQLNDFQNYGIRGTSVTGFTLSNTIINGTNGTTSAGGSEEGAVRFDGLFTTGSFAAAQTASISNSTLGGTGGSDLSFSDDLRVINSSGTLNRLTITNTNFGKIGINGNNGLTFSALNNGTVMNLTVQDSVFTNAIGSLATITFSNNSTMDVVVRRNKFSNNNVNQSSGGGGLVLQGGSGASTVTYDISCNSFRDAVGIALLVAKGNGSGTIVGDIINNTVGVTGVALSGSTQAAGIKVKATGTGTHTVMIRDNVVRQTNEEGIFIQNNDGSATLNASVFGNTVAEPGAFSFAGLNVDIGALGTDTSICNVVVGSAGTAGDKNDFSAGDPFNFSDVNLSRIAGAGTQLNLSKNGSASGTAAAVIDDDNLNPATTNTGVSGTVNLVLTLPPLPPAVASCTIPPIPNPGDLGAMNAAPTSNTATSLAKQTDVSQILTAIAQPQTLATLSNVLTGSLNNIAPHTETPERKNEAKATSPIFASTTRAAHFSSTESKAQVSHAATIVPVKTASLESANNRSREVRSNHAVRRLALADDKPLSPQSGGTVNLSVGTITPGSTVVLTFQVTVDSAAPANASNVSNQGTVSGSNFASVLTDDPDTVAALDPTLTPLLHPTAANGIVSGRITTSDGTPVEGAVMTLSGAQSRKMITDANGNYRFDNVETNGFYTVTPARANYNFNPFNRSFTQIGNATEAIFTATSTGDSVNPLDTPEYFVRQQYVDLLGREPEEDGFNYWSDRILECGSDALCVNARRRDVAAAFFIEAEFQQTGSFIYGLYKGSLGRTPAYVEFSSDRQHVIGGPNLETMKQTFVEDFVGRAEFLAKYQANTTAESFVNALLENVQQTSGIDLSSQRAALTVTYNTGANLNESRSLVVRELTESADFRQAEYNAAFVLTEYFGYLRRDAEPEGYNFWLDVLNNREPGNFRGMVCSFITSREYQQRFSVIVSHSNQECGQ